MAKSLQECDRCPGIHLPEPRPTCTPILWYPMRSARERIRVQAYTCECLHTFYELCHAGGQGFLRRTRRTHRTPYMDESLRMPQPRALLMWTALLTGDVL
ncbi:hypothetical protein GCM10010176_089400 [Nonomuraea spiralis]|nr:hypothetical protein GCM10010176_089400 [Nonomuraea spiralis]